MATSYTPAQIATLIYGDEEAEAKAKVTQLFKEAMARHYRSLGYRSSSDFIRDVLHVAVLGAPAVEQCHLSRLRGGGQSGAENGLDSGFGSAL